MLNIKYQSLFNNKDLKNLYFNFPSNINNQILIHYT